MDYLIKRVRKLFRYIFPKSKIIFNDFNASEPVSDIFGFDRGTPIDRYYIEKFLSDNDEKISGTVLEVGDDDYTKKFGHDIQESSILHYQSKSQPNSFVGDLSRVETLPSCYYDCFICTQTLNFIYDTRSAVKGCYHLLKTGGVLIGTVSGISQISKYDMERWGDYWRFTNQSVSRILNDAGFSDIQVHTYGNVLSSTAFLQGVAVEDLPQKSLLDIHDPSYQHVICFIARK